jgi:hypothetical protein
MTYDDSIVDYWGEIYTASPRLQAYCSFEQFLARPREIIAGVGRAPLAAQLAIRRALDSTRRQA